MLATESRGRVRPRQMSPGEPRQERRGYALGEPSFFGPDKYTNYGIQIMVAIWLGAANGKAPKISDEADSVP